MSKNKPNQTPAKIYIKIDAAGNIINKSWVAAPDLPGQYVAYIAENFLELANKNIKAANARSETTKAVNQDLYKTIKQNKNILKSCNEQNKKLKADLARIKKDLNKVKENNKKLKKELMANRK